MDRSEKHIINRINLTVECNHAQLPALQAVGLADEVQKCLEDITPFLNEHFGSSITRIPELSISLDLDESILSQFRKSLSEQLTSELADLDAKGVERGSARLISDKRISPEKAFMYFLENGEMPWFSLKPEPEKIDFSEPGIKADLLELLAGSEIARERLADQVPIKLVNIILLEILGQKVIDPLFSFLEIIEQEARNYSKRFAAGHRLRQHFLKYSFHAVFAQGFDNDWQDLVALIWPSFLIHTKDECNGRHIDFLELLSDKLPGSLRKEHKFEGAVPSNTKIPKTNLLRQFDSRKYKSNPAQGDGESGTKEQRQLVYNAGLVLLHPFIKRFFQKVGLLENDQFISLAHQQRAICLLHVLATGNTIFPEEEMVLAKVLCHYPVKKPIPRELPISEFELEEINQLLKSAISHWGALKKTSIEGLRINFLQRKGTLEQDGPGTTLYVEKHTADILIDQLPWGLSIIHFPWLPNVLTIKWR